MNKTMDFEWAILLELGCGDCIVVSLGTAENVDLVSFGTAEGAKDAENV